MNLFQQTLAATLVLAVLSPASGEGTKSQTRMVTTQSGGRVEHAQEVTTVTVDSALTTVIVTTGTTGETFVLNPDGQVIRYDLRSPEGEVSVVNDGTVIRSSGQAGGKVFQGEGSTKGLPYYAQPAFSLKAFAKNGFRNFSFLMVPPASPSGSFELVYSLEGKEVLNGTPVWKVKVSPPGLLSIFYHAYFWIREDGTLVRFQGDHGPGTPYQIIDWTDSPTP